MIPEKLGDIQLLRLTSRDHPPPPEEYLAADSTGSFFDDFSTHDVVCLSFFLKLFFNTFFGNNFFFIIKKNFSQVKKNNKIFFTHEIFSFFSVTVFYTENNNYLFISLGYCPLDGWRGSKQYLCNCKQLYGRR